MAAEYPLCDNSIMHPLSFFIVGHSGSLRVGFCFVFEGEVCSYKQFHRTSSKLACKLLSISLYYIPDYFLNFLEVQ